jgi:SAM-dependent methyltransferase
MDSLRRRHPGSEFLDGDSLDPDDLRVNLREMAMLNRLPGGIRASVGAIERALNGTSPARVLDVGTGAGDLPYALLTGRRRGRVQVVASDLRREVLAHARRRLRNLRDADLLEADARRLPLSDGAVDVAHASLVLHHFEPTDAMTALREMRRVAREAVVVNDLRRGPLAFAMTALTVLALSRGRYTRHDGVLSARRAYTLDELDALADEAGLRLAWRSAPYLPRVVSVYR